MSTLTIAKPRIILDIDSTIWAAEEEYDKASIELYGRRWYDDDSPYDWYDEADLVERYGPDYHRIFAHALDPATVGARNLYPYCASALREIAETYRLTFVTHHHAPTTMRRALKSWLDGSLGGLPFSLHVYTARVSKADKARTLGAGIIVDDKPQTLRESVAAGLYTITKEHPWNTPLLTSVPEIRSFTSWEQIPGLLRSDGML